MHQRLYAPLLSLAFITHEGLGINVQYLLLAWLWLGLGGRGGAGGGLGAGRWGGLRLRGETCSRDCFTLASHLE